MSGSVVNISFRLPHVSMRLIARRPKTKLTAPSHRQEILDGWDAQEQHTKAGTEPHGAQLVAYRVDKESIFYLSVSPISPVRVSHTRVESKDVDYCHPVSDSV